MRLLASPLILLLLASFASAQEPLPGDKWVKKYLTAETARVTNDPLKQIKSLDQWEANKAEYRRQVQEMLGLDPLPERGDLQATITGQIERDGIVVENLHFQSSPHLYVTANLYRPAKVEGKLPAILYVCGHGKVKIDGVSYGNKSHYQHHGAWFARHGFVCLVVDSLELGEIEGTHKGLYSDQRRWWTNRGYTSAGVEAWNCIRSLDYLQSRDEVDGDRLGVTGRSGGGAYSWWVAALDDRIKAAVPVAGVTDLKNHVVDNCVEGHCDCMYWVNTYQHDYTLLPALVAPRPLMIGNTDRDGIFPLDGVNRCYFAARDIYELYGKAPNLALTITPGPHKDTQQLRIPAFHWLREHLQGESPPITDVALPLFTPQELQVFTKLPVDEINTTIDETFVAVAPPAVVPQSSEQWEQICSELKNRLTTKSFRAWPEAPVPLDLKLTGESHKGDWEVDQYEFNSQEHASLPLFIFQSSAAKKRTPTRLIVVDQQQWQAYAAFLKAPNQAPCPLGKPNADQAVAVLPVRGIGPTQWNQHPRKDTHIRRRFLLLGQSLDGMRVWDIRRAAQAATQIGTESSETIDVVATGNLAGLAVYAAIFEPTIGALDLTDLPANHRNGPYFLNVSRFMSMPEALAIAGQGRSVKLTGDTEVGTYRQEVLMAIKK
ncbi:acetylxylan esterase [Bremerella cremea]|uniref:Acetylxylan esterase n=1 Tax=Bremerella cremea TaxID=1031537 RepID=A0A368KY38_9BACT|nr:acetylxylan esterase [Bremerella cremea]RCS54635.1 acetylxylan esterase [Bremerella cremea]